MKNSLLLTSLLFLSFLASAQITFEAQYPSPIVNFTRIDFPFAGERYVVKTLNGTGYELYDAEHTFLETVEILETELFDLISITEGVYKDGPGYELAAWFIDNQGMATTEVWVDGEMIWQASGDLFDLNVLPTSTGNLLMVSSIFADEVEFLELPSFTPIGSIPAMENLPKPVQLNDGSYRYCRLNDNFQIEIYDESFSLLNLVSLPNLGVDVTARIEQLGTSIFDTDDGLEFAVSSFDAAYPGLMYWLIDEDGSVIFNHEGNLIVVNPEDSDPSFFTVSTNFQNESTFTIYRAQNQEIINSVELPFGDIFFAYHLPVVGPTYFISQRDPERIEAFDQAFNSLFVQENAFQLEEDENLFINGATYDRFGSGGVEFLAEILGPDNVQETFLLSENGQVLFSTGFAEFLQINELPGLQPKLVGNIFPLTVNVYGGDFDLNTKSLQTPTHSLTLLPNPAHAELNWRADLSVEKYEIWDANGVLQSYGPVNSNTLSIEDLNPGFYIIHLRGEQTWQGSFVKN